MFARNARCFFQYFPICKSFGRDFNFTWQLLDVQVKMPALSPTMTSGTIVKWMKKEGDSVSSGDVLCEIQTDKAVVAMEVDDEGVLAKIVVPENTPDVQVGSLIAIMVEEGKDWKQVKVPEGAATAAASPPAAKPAEKPSAAAAPPTKPHEGRSTKIIGPSVKSLLHLYKLNAKEIPATGPYGILLKGDVLKYITAKSLSPKPVTAAPPPAIAAKKQPSPKPATKPSPVAPVAKPGTAFTDVPLTNMRKTIAKRLTESKMSIPHAYNRISVNMNSVLKFRKQLKADGVVVSVNDFIIKACASALRQVPQVNVQFVGESVKQMNTVDISVAVATESGLITPIVHNADQLGIMAISAKVKELADKAKANKLQLNEFQGGTFTVSNLGMYGISQFTAIINPPQSAILAVGGTSHELTDDLKSQDRMVVTLCYDNRAIDDDAAARWLSAFQSSLEDSSIMLLGLYSSSVGNSKASAVL